MFDKYFIYDGRAFISSLDWYKKSGLNRTNYSRWIKDNFAFGRLGKDYLLITDAFPDLRGRPPKEYIISASFAISLCRLAKHNVAIAMIESLEELDRA